MNRAFYTVNAQFINFINLKMFIFFYFVVFLQQIIYIDDYFYI